MDLKAELGKAEQGNLLSLLLVLAENAKLLILGPFIAGLLALGVAFALPEKFTSEAILAIPSGGQSAAQAASLMRSPLVLDQVIAAFDLAQGQSISRARQAFVENVKATLGKDGLLRLQVTGPSPTQAQSLANAVIDAWIKTTKPPEQDRKDLETRLRYAKASLEGVSGLLARLTKESAGYLAQPLSRGEAGSSLASVGELQVRYLNEVLSVTRALQGLSRDVVVQAPTLPTEHVSPKKSLITVLATVAVGLVLLLWVFMRRSWQALAAQSQAGDKLGKLR